MRASSRCERRVCRDAGRTLPTVLNGTLDSGSGLDFSRLEIPMDMTYERGQRTSSILGQ